jgi:nitrogen fixation protein FixH
VSLLGVTRTGTGRGQVRFRVTDASSPVVACRVAVNAGEWQAVDAGMADALDVTLAADVALGDGAWTIAVWAADAQGNTGAGRKTGR